MSLGNTELNKNKMFVYWKVLTAIKRPMHVKNLQERSVACSTSQNYLTTESLFIFLKTSTVGLAVPHDTLQKVLN